MIFFFFFFLLYADAGNGGAASRHNTHHQTHPDKRLSFPGKALMKKKNWPRPVILIARSPVIPCIILWHATCVTLIPKQTPKRFHSSSLIAQCSIVCLRRAGQGDVFRYLGDFELLFAGRDVSGVNPHESAWTLLAVINVRLQGAR